MMRIVFKKKFWRVTNLILCLILLQAKVLLAQTSQDDVPMIGAEVFIEPGQTPENIDDWFRSLKECGMTVTRIRMFESYMHKTDGTWDFTLFDQAFKAGDKYGIKIYANLFPATSFTDVGGFKFPKSDAHLVSIADYIKHLVTHFSKFKSLYGWVPINEPGNGGIPNDAFSNNRFYEWKISHSDNNYDNKGFQVFNFAEQRFLVNYDTWFLNWLSTEIHKYDPGSAIHVNNHAIFQNVAEYDFPQWRKFLTSLGGSAHASWHFGYFTRPQYCVAMSANSEIIRSGAGNLPWLMTELQGGNNTYSGGVPMCPTKEETAQWLWTTIGTGSKGGIFWCLNPRSAGFESGEWAMLDYQDKPSDRMMAAAAVAKTIINNSQLFAKARVVESGINIIYCREALWVEKKLVAEGDIISGRDGAVMKSALGYFEALSEMGLQSNFKEIGEFDFSAKSYSGKTIILAHQISIPSKYWPLLETFVSKGGKLIVDGLSAYYDENARCLLRDGFPLQQLFGGNIKEIKVVNPPFDAQLEGINLPVRLWQGTILPTTGLQVAAFNEEATAVRNKYGSGEVLWVPSLLGLGARRSGTYLPLVQLLQRELKTTIAEQPIVFKLQQPGMLMKTLRSDNNYLSVVINKSKDKRIVDLQTSIPIKKSQILFADKTARLVSSGLEINPEETVVIKWER